MPDLGCLIAALGIALRGFAFAVLGLHSWNRIGALEPAAEIDFGAALGAERAESQSPLVLVERALADRTKPRLCHGLNSTLPGRDLEYLPAAVLRRLEAQRRPAAPC